MASDNPPEISEVPNSGWDARIRVFRCGNIVDCFAVITDRFVVIVDTLIGTDSLSIVIEGLVSEFSSRALLVVNTHGDWDHVWGNALFAVPGAGHPAPIFGHRSTAEAIQSTESRDLLERFQREQPRTYASASWVTPSVLFDGDLSIDAGDLQLDLISTPGHTVDHLSVWIPAIWTLLAGDAVECPMPYVNVPRDLPVLRSSLQRLLDLNPVHVLCSHAPGITEPAVIDWNLSYFAELEHRCRALLSSHPAQTDPVPASLGWPLLEAVPTRFLPSADSWKFYEESHERAIRAMLAWLRGAAM